MRKNVRIVLADDHPVVRQGFRMILEKQPDMEIVGEAGDGREVVELAEELHPDIVVMDVAMPGLNGIEATRRLMSLTPPPTDSTTPAASEPRPEGSGTR